MSCDGHHEDWKVCIPCAERAHRKALILPERFVTTIYCPQCGITMSTEDEPSLFKGSAREPHDSPCRSCVMRWRR